MTANYTSASLSSQEWEYEHPLGRGILVGIDGSIESIAALHTAAGIVRRRGIPLHVAIVIPEFPTYGRGGISRETLDELRVSLKGIELDEIMRIIQPEETGWTHEIVTGNTVAKLAEIAEGRDAEVIVVGRHRHSAIDRALGADTTLRLMRRSKVPVLALDSVIPEFHTAVSAIDFSPSSITAAREAAALLTSPATLFLAYVDRPAEIHVTPGAVAARNDLPGDMVTKFRRVAEAIRPPAGVTVHPCVLCGRPAPALLKYAEEVDADLLSAGSHGYNMLERVLLGSVSTALVRNAQRALVVAAAKDQWREEA